MSTSQKEPEGSIYFAAFWLATGKVITAKGNLGTYVPIWDNPISARDWAQAQSIKAEFYIRAVDILYSPQPE